MKTKFYKNPLGYLLVYPTKAIYASGVRIPNSIFVCGRGPTAAGDPTTVSDQVFQPSGLGIEVSPDDVPSEWREPLGLSATLKLVAPVVEPVNELEVQPRTVKVDIDFDNADFEYIAKVLVGGIIGFVVGLIGMYLI